MKTILHSQTVPFEFIGFEYERGEIVTSVDIEVALDAYKGLAGAIKGGDGLDKDDFDDFSERYLAGQEMTSEDLESYQKMDLTQQEKVQWAKKAKARIKAKTNKE